MTERISAALKLSKRLRAAARRLLWQRKGPKGPAYQTWELGRSARPPLLPPPHPLFRGAAGKGKKARETQVSCRAASAMSKRPADNPLGALWQRAAPHPSPWLRRASRRPPPGFGPPTPTLEAEADARVAPTAATALQPPVPSFPSPTQRPYLQWRVHRCGLI